MARMIEIAVARALYYSLFSRLFVFSIKPDRFDGVSKMLSLMSAASFDENSAQVIMRLSANFDEKNPQNIIDEYDDIFHSPPKPLRNSFSYYDEGYEVGHSCLKIKKLLATTDIRRDEQNFKENEDSVGFVFTIMSEFLQRLADGKDEYEALSEELFTEIINPNIDEFCENLFMHKEAKFYKDVATLLQSFMEFERIYYEAAKPAPKESNKKAYENVSRSEMIRREKNRIRKMTAKNLQGEE